MLLCGHIVTVRYNDGGCVGAVSFLDHLTHRHYAIHGEWPEPVIDLKRTLKGGLLVAVVLNGDSFQGKPQYNISNMFAESLPLARSLLLRYANPDHVSHVIHALLAPYAHTPNYPTRLATITPAQCVSCPELLGVEVAQVVQTIFSPGYVAFCDEYLLSSIGRTALWQVGNTSEHAVQEFITRAPYQAARIALAHKPKKDQTFQHVDHLVTAIFLQPLYAPERVRRFVVEALKHLIEQSQDTCVEASLVLHQTRTLLQVVPGTKVDRVVENVWLHQAGPWYIPPAVGFKKGELEEDWPMYVESRVVRGQVKRFVYPLPHWEAEQTIALHLMCAAHIPATPGLDAVVCATDKTLDVIQAGVLARVNDHPVTLITGSPGTGKTFITSLVIAQLQAQDYLVLVACPTGRAAQRLSTILAPPICAQLMFGGPITLHKLLESQHTAFEHSETVALIVDELSMAGLQLLASVLHRLPHLPKIVLVGDPFQLPSIPPGKLISDFLRAAPSLLQVCTLEHIYRTRGRTICANAQVVRQMIAQDEQGLLGAPTGRAAQLQQGEDFIIINRRSTATERAAVSIEFYQTHACQFTQCQILCQKVDTCQTLNLFIRDAVNPTGPEYQRYNTSRVWRFRDRVICTRNIYRKPIDEEANADGTLKIVACNGQMGTLVRIGAPRGPDAPIGICFDDSVDTVVSFLGSELTEYFDWAYAITVHKAQGGEWRFVYMHLDAPDRSPLHSAHLFYTGFTRAQDSVILDGPVVCLERALATTNVVSRRQSFLAHRLQNTPAAQAALARYQQLHPH